MIALLRDNPLLLLFVIAAIGWPLGRIQLGGARLGVAGVLFAGLAVGALDPALKLPEIVYILGLVIFVYTVGLASGSSFLASLRRQGLRDNLFIIIVLVAAAAFIILLAGLLGLQPTAAAGLFAGSLTNTPALAVVLEHIREIAPADALEAMLAQPVVAYSIAYPMGVLAMIVTTYLVQRVWKIDYQKEGQRAGSQAGRVTLDNRTVLVTRSAATEAAISDLIQRHHWNVVFGRIKRAEEISLASGQASLQLGDLVTVVGDPEELDRVTTTLGEASQTRLDLEGRELDYRRVFVSNPALAGHTLRSLNLPQQFGAVITRVRRGDIMLVPHGDTVLELGDRVRVLAHRAHLEGVTGFLGDSYRAVSEIDVLTFSLGLALGVLLGLLPIPLPGGLTLRLGMAGGPLIAALVLGAIGRTGPFQWNIPFSTNLTLRQFGLLLFLAGVGSQAGYTFVTTLTQGGGLTLFSAGLFITVFAALATLWVGYALLRIPMGLLTGMLAGLQTQPALLSFAADQSGDELPNIGYATVYPIATITKIILAQVILAWLLG